MRDLAQQAASGEIENASLASFLEALSAWVDDMDGYFANQGIDAPVEPSWRLIAMMLRAATVYE